MATFVAEHILHTRDFVAVSFGSSATQPCHGGKAVRSPQLREIGVVREEYAVSSDGKRMFDVMDLSSGFEGCRFGTGAEQPRQVFPAELHRRAASLRLREPCFSRGIYSSLGEAFQTLLAGGQLGHRCRSHAAKLRPIEAAGRRLAAMQLSTAAAKLLIYRALRRKQGFPNTWRDECTTCIFGPYTTNSSPVPCGACRTPSPARLRNWSRFRNIRLRPNWRDFCRQYDLPNTLEQPAFES